MGCPIRRCLPFLPEAKSDGADFDNQTNLETLAWITTYGRCQQPVRRDEDTSPRGADSMPPSCNFGEEGLSLLFLLEQAAELGDQLCSDRR